MKKFKEKKFFYSILHQKKIKFLINKKSIFFIIKRSVKPNDNWKKKTKNNILNIKKKFKVKLYFYLNLQQKKIKFVY